MLQMDSQEEIKEDRLRKIEAMIATDESAMVAKHKNFIQEVLSAKDIKLLDIDLLDQVLSGMASSQKKAMNSLNAVINGMELWRSNGRNNGFGNFEQVLKLIENNGVILPSNVRKLES